MAEGSEARLHRSLTESILLADVPRAVAIVNDTLAAALGIGLQLWLAGIVFCIVGHTLGVWGAKSDPQFMEVFASDCP